MTIQIGPETTEYGSPKCSNPRWKSSAADPISTPSHAVPSVVCEDRTRSLRSVGSHVRSFNIKIYTADAEKKEENNIGSPVFGTHRRARLGTSPGRAGGRTDGCKQTSKQARAGGRTDGRIVMPRIIIVYNKKTGCTNQHRGSGRGKRGKVNTTAPKQNHTLMLGRTRTVHGIKEGRWGWIRKGKKKEM